MIDFWSLGPSAAAFGLRANHFTVRVNALQRFGGLPELDAFLVRNGFALNDAGGRIKGSAVVYLEQSSTLAEPVEVEFSDGVRRIPGCYYEFARRYAAYLQESPEVLVAHGAVMRELG